MVENGWSAGQRLGQELLIKGELHNPIEAAPKLGQQKKGGASRYQRFLADPAVKRATAKALGPNNKGSDFFKAAGVLWKQNQHGTSSRGEDAAILGDNDDMGHLDNEFGASIMGGDEMGKGHMLPRDVDEFLDEIGKMP